MGMDFFVAKMRMFMLKNVTELCKRLTKFTHLTKKGRHLILHINVRRILLINNDIEHECENKKKSPK
jgi:hypothetical protein